ncbi:hypothetical protein M9H77_28973 [Catharanthus roseus]|uniref:Uncharacterized protein n=1 Tax=Catharanthus roseus TaxID=4058 RepID=A0ACC0AIH4_CATRO|nr:hypothetical protein M9H77_28973 [Catharanthus roseus]
MSLVSWAKKELSRFGLLQKNRKLLLPQRRLLTPPVKSSIPSPGKEVVVAADLRCDECQRRVSALLSQIEGIC